MTATIVCSTLAVGATSDPVAAGSVVGSIAVTEPNTIAVDPVRQRLYVASSGRTAPVTLSVFDSATGLLIDSSSLPARLSSMVVDMRTGSIYTIREAATGTGITVFSGDLDVVAEIAVPGARALAVNWQTGRLYVGTFGLGEVVTIDLTTNSIIGRVDVDPTEPTGVVWGLSVDEVNDRVYFIDPAGPRLGYVDGSTGALALSADVGLSPAAAIAVDPVTGKLYVAENGLYGFRTYDADTLEEIPGFGNGILGWGVTSLAVNRLTGRLYVTRCGACFNYDREAGPGVLVVDTTSGLEVDDIDTPPTAGSTVLDPYRGQLFVGQGNYNSVAIVQDVQDVPGGPVPDVDPPGDDDGVSSEDENGVGAGGDGNGDGVADASQDNVTSLPSPVPSVPYLTIAVPSPATLSSVSAADPASLGVPLPAGVTTDAPVASYSVAGLVPGAAVDVDLYYSAPVSMNALLKFQNGGWVALPPDAATIVSPTRVTLHLVDGGVGDADGIADGVIVDPVLPVVRAVDVDGPIANPTASPEPNAAGWTTGDVAVEWNWSDGGSGLDPELCETSSIVVGEGAGLQATSVCADLGGNESSSTIDVSIDRTPPVITCPADATAVLRSGTARLTATVSDALSGPAAPTVTVSLPATSVGSMVASVSATDVAGNTATVSCPYQVVYDVRWLVPIGGPTGQRSAVRNTSVPFTYLLLDAAGVPVSGAAVPVTTSTSVTCPSGTFPAVVSVPGRTVTAPLGRGWYTAGWRATGGRGTCQRVTVTIADGTARSMVVKVV